MKLFIDTANTAHIREAESWGVICGVTTNPSLIAQEGRDFKEVVKEITAIVDGPISAEVIDTKHEGMITEARDCGIHKLNQPHFVITPDYRGEDRILVPDYLRANA